MPDPVATIASVDHEHIRLGPKNFDKYKTTVSFTDGFYYISYKTKYESAGFGCYRMTPKTEKIRRAAIKKHIKLASRYQR